MLTAYAEVECAAAPADAGGEEQRLAAYAPLVKRIVRQLASQVGGSIDVEDMQQIGLLALLDALRRYGEPDAKFASYAALRIRGAILDELRRQDWRPRSVRQGSHRTRDAVRDLERRLGREPTAAEIREALGVTAEEYREHELAQNAEQLASLDEALQELSALNGESPEAQLLVRRSIEQALLRLNEREQRVVQLYYEFDLNLKEIAAVLELTEARVCQINKAALKKLKDFLQ
jgi:RNA polymerase sigma factor for flagellar operon FliA